MLRRFMQRRTENPKHPAALDLARGALGQLLAEVDAAGDLERGQFTLKKPAEIGRCRHRAWMQDDRSGDVLAEARMGDSVSSSLDDRRMAQERGIDLGGGDFFSATIDQLTHTKRREG